MFQYLKRLIVAFIFITGFILSFISCKKAPEPNATVSVKINGNIATFTSEATEAESFSWDFGDGSDGSTEQNPVHIYTEYGKEYIVTLTVKGPGGSALVTTIVSISPMTKMEMLTGGENAAGGREWRLDPDAEIFVAVPDAVFTASQRLAPGILSSWGFTSAYNDKYIFRYDGTFSIIPAGPGIPAGLMYCTSKNIANTPPSQAAMDKGLTQINSYQPQMGLTYGFNESKDLELQVCTDGRNVTNVTIPDVTTLTFSKEAFLGMKDWNSECVILDVTENSMKVVVFISTVPVDSPNKGKISFAFILPFSPAS